jgi:hypothetical protein
MTLITAFFEYIPKWVWVALVAVLFATSCKLQYSNAQLETEVNNAATKVAQAEKATADVRADHQALVAKAEADYSKQLEAHRRAEQELQVAMDNQRRKLNETTTALAATRDDLRMRFLSGEARGFTAAAPTSVNERGTAVPGQTTTVSAAPELSSPIGDLIDEATRADTIRWALIGCYQAYDDAKAKLSGEVKDVDGPQPKAAEDGQK